MTSTIEQTLHQLERPQAHLLRTWDVDRIDRLRASTWCRRLLPASAALRTAGLVGGLRWMLAPEERRRASLWAMRMLAAEQPTAATRRLARRGMMDEAVKGELAWRPWTVASMEVKGIEHLRTVRREGRGVILASAHIGPYFELLRVLGLREGRIWVARYRPIRGEALPGYYAVRRVAAYRLAEEAGVRFVGRGSSYDGLKMLLARGEVCFLMFDFRGATKTSFLGRRRRLGGGTASLASRLDVPVVPVFAVRRGHRQVGEMLAPLWPGEFSSPASLQEALADLVSGKLKEHACQAYPPEGVLAKWSVP